MHINIMWSLLHFLLNMLLNEVSKKLKDWSHEQVQNDLY